MSQPARGYAQFVEIRQPPERVFAAFADARELQGWYATEASVEPRRGGRLRVKLGNGRVRDATIDVWEPGRRLRLIYMPDPTLPASATGPIVEDVLFDVKPGLTVVRVLGNGVPGEREWDTHFLALRRGWAFWLHSLKKYLEGTPAPERGA
ncbi:MAG TPA: SRPBCC domain-containing protein [Steroidobacteraceae bacterium]|nr:SRPBCC domain-containing protein [Steroidobacteraceae bacterium]